MLIDKFNVKVLKSCIRIKASFFDKKIFKDILYIKQNFENKGWMYIENIDTHLDFIHKNFVSLYKLNNNVHFTTCKILPGELLLVDKNTDEFKYIPYEINGEKFKTHFKISTNGTIITDITLDD